MPLELNPGTLWQLGYKNLTRQQTMTALHEIYETLEYVVGRRIAARLNRGQLKEFERLYDQGQDRSTLAWLENAVPDYSEIVRAENQQLMDRLEGALRAARRASRQESSNASS